MTNVQVPKAQMSQVSIVILNWNKPELAAQCAESVLAHSADVGQIIIADNGSTTKNLNYLARHFSHSKVQIHSIGVNRYFGEGNNIAAEKATGKYLLFLNNDVTVTKGWLEPLLELLDSDPAIGAVGPKFVYPNGTLQEAGAFLDSRGASVQLGKGQSAEDPRFNKVREVHYVSAACILLLKADFESVGGFNFVYEPAYYEDTELCFSIRSLLDKKILYQPASTVVHIESATTADPSSSLKLNNISEINRIKFLQRWGGDQASVNRPKLSIQRPIETAIRQRSRVGIYTPFALTLGGGEKYILSVAEALLSKGYEVTLVTDHPYSRVRVMALGEEFGLDLSNLLSNTYSLACSEGFDLFISMGNEYYPPVNPIGKKNIHHCQFPFPTLDNTSEGKRRMPNVDAVVVNSEFTRKEYLETIASRDLPIPPLQIIHPPVSGLNTRAEALHEKTITSVGRFFVGGHSKRQDILIQAFENLLTKHPTAKLNLVGGSLAGNEHREFLSHCQYLARGLPVTFHVDASTSSLEALLRKSSVYWHAAGFGVDQTINPGQCEHFGISVVEAMSAGVIPIVVGSGGPDEVVSFGSSGFKYHTMPNLVRRTDLVFRLPKSDRRRISETARAESSKYDVSVFAEKWTTLAGQFI